MSTCGFGGFGEGGVWILVLVLREFIGELKWGVMLIINILERLLGGGWVIVG